jgi:glycerophosphoryl diester phosphodiesterase
MTLRPLRVTTLFILGLGLNACDEQSVTASLSEASPKISMRTQAAPEGTAANGLLRMPVLREGSLESALQLWASTSIDSQDASPADPATDFEALEQVPIRWEAGQREAIIELRLLADGADEAAETVWVEVQANPGGLPLARAPAIIANDDQSCSGLPADNPWLERRPIGFAHRGGVREFPENTLFAYTQAQRLGLEVLEMDVYPTADGEIVVIHDATVDRTTDSSGDVSSLTLAELQALDAAYWFVPGVGTTREADEADYVYRGIAKGDKPAPAGFRPADFRIPTLQEALAAYPNHLLNVELKPSPQTSGEYEAEVARILQDYGRNTDVMVASFLDTSAALFKANAPCMSTAVPTAQVAAAVIAGQGPLPGLPLGSLYHAFQVPPALGLEVVNADFVDDAHANGLAVHVWTIDDCAQMISLLELGVDGIMTDRPALLAALLAQPAAQRSCAALG